MMWCVVCGARCAVCCVRVCGRMGVRLCSVLPRMIVCRILFGSVVWHTRAAAQEPDKLWRKAAEQGRRASTLASPSSPQKVSIPFLAGQPRSHDPRVPTCVVCCVLCVVCCVVDG